MSEVALLNPQLDLETSQRMLRIAETRLEREKQKLLSVLLDRENYLMTYGAMMAAQETFDALDKEYRSMTRK